MSKSIQGGTDMNHSHIEQVLLKIAALLNNSNIEWALGGSLLLFYEHYDVTVHDIDIIVNASSRHKLDVLLKDIPYKTKRNDGIYKTTYFYKLTIAGIGVDVMIDFKLQVNQQLYQFPFYIAKHILVKNEIIYLCSVAEWKKAYTLMGRIDKVKLLENMM